MGSLSATHWLIATAVILVVFGGRGRVSAFMSDVGRGIRSFRRELADVRELTDIRLK